MNYDSVYLFSNEKSSLGIMDKIFCKAFVTLPYVNLKCTCEEAYMRLLLGMSRFRSCVIVDEKVIKEECECQI
ncbi:MAG: hypothetical protein COB07_11970 [Sulfurovum sp.]|nr:MAG: hypothetical protein COB07_11970 [Sulfurovum sp.]